MRPRPELVFAAVVLLSGCAHPSMIWCAAIGLGDSGDGELTAFSVTSPASGAAFDEPIPFTFDYEATQGIGIEAELYVDGVVVASGSADDTITWTPAHDSGDVTVTVRGFSSYEQVFVEWTVDWSAPWQGALRQCAALACAATTDVTLADTPTRLLASPDFDVARVAEVVYAIDDVEVATRNAPPFWIDLDATAAAPGTHTLTATIRRDDGEEITATATLVVP